VPVERVEAALHEELDKLAREPISDDELARARALIETEELAALSRVEERADRLSMYATLFDDPDLINRMLGRYLSITAEQIQAVSADVFRADNRVVLTYLQQLPPADSAANTDDEAEQETEKEAAELDADEEVAA
jgi:predicted Zn-dependent peptidase